MAKKNRKRSSADKPDRQITALTESGTVTAVEPPTGPVESATTAVGASSVTSPLSPEVKADVFSLTSPLSPEGRPGSNPVAPQTATAVATGSVAFDATVSPMDHILIFGHGVFQRLILLCTLLSVFCTILHAEASSNLARPVDHWCRPPAAYANLPPETWKNASIPVELDGSYSGCFRYEPPFVPQSTNSSRDSRETVPCDAGWDYAREIHEISALLEKYQAASSGKPAASRCTQASTRVSIVGEWNLVCDRRWLMSVLTACYMAGSLLIMPFVGTAADRLGRRPVLGFSLSILIVSGILLAFSSTLFMFASLRFFISASAGSLVVISIVQLFEVTDSSRRVLYCSIAVTGGFSAAHVYGELVYDWVYDWSLIQLFCMVPTGLLIGAVYFVEESPCWLLATFRIKRAAEVVMSAARMNGADMLLVGKRLEVIRQEARKARAEATMTTGEGMLEASPAELFTNRALRNETLVIYGCWFLANSFSYRLRASREDRVVYRALVALAIPTVAANVFLLSTKGRRLSTALSLVLLGSVMASLAGVSFFVPGHIFFTVITYCTGITMRKSQNNNISSVAPRHHSVTPSPPPQPNLNFTHYK
ncbi:hypothetical protein V5799_022079 [Amblyomma americanum]|uniref:Major facilitator superfamily (MFS) profile domain-containing protein n=1 Tax=Amblyomma americanum TaxID=6943 RepID=A0AAQ4FN49_AMBAM